MLYLIAYNINHIYVCIHIYKLAPRVFKGYRWSSVCVYILLWESGPRLSFNSQNGCGHPLTATKGKWLETNV